MNEEDFYKEIAAQLGIPVDAVREVMQQGGGPAAELEAGYNDIMAGRMAEQMGGRMSTDDIVNYNVNKAMANPSSRPGPLDYSVNLNPGNIPQPTTNMIMDERSPSGAGAYVEQVNTPNPVQGLVGNMGRNPCAMMPGTVWNGKACVPASLMNVGVNF